MEKPKVSGATAPYQLRPCKAIERNLFTETLRLLDAANSIDLTKYRYVGFGAAFLEDFKVCHLELGMAEMHSIEFNKHAYSRQQFNNPYHFLTPYNLSSTDYISDKLESNKNQVIWLDYTNNDLGQQLIDIELLCAKLLNIDIIKFTFNTERRSFINSHHVLNEAGTRCSEADTKSLLEYLNNHPTYQNYLPSNIKSKDVKSFSDLVRAMALRAINRGLSKNENKKLNFYHISCFKYTDGQEISTVTGVVSDEDSFKSILEESKLKDWKFYIPQNGDTELIEAVEISVPAMTVLERLEIDRKIPAGDIPKMAADLPFYYGNVIDDHVFLIEGYHTFYKYLPYYSKVIY